MTEQQLIIFLAFMVCVTMIVCVGQVCRTWRIVTLMKQLGVPKEKETEEDAEL